MSYQISFQEMFDKFLSNLMSTYKVIEIYQKFGPEKSVQEMFSHLWELKEADKSLQVTLDVKCKNDAKAEQLRKEGNKFYQAKNLSKSLEFYNKSIIHSPQPNLNISKSDTDQDQSASLNDSSKNLSFGYANRSAVLFELGNYKGCLTDISRSILNGYPAILRPKLVEREAKCHLAQNNRNKAQEILNEGLLNLKLLGLEDRSMIQTKGNLESLLSQCTSTKKGEDTIQSEVQAKYKYLSRIKLPKIPSLPDANIKIPALSKAVDLSYEPEKGRFLVANRDIMPGEVVIKEKGFSCTVLPSSLPSHCSYCLQRTITPVPCPNCVSVVFCSEDCSASAMNEFHNIECILLPALLALDMGKNPTLALRLVVKLTISKLRERISQYLKEGKEKSKATAGFNEQNMYLSDDYRTIYLLVTNKGKRTVEDLFRQCCIAYCLVKLLLKVKYFGNQEENCQKGNHALKENILFVGEVLVTHLMSLQCNSHAVNELSVNRLDTLKSYIEEVGVGIFSVLSLACHSCNPTLVRIYYGSTVAARAIQFIPKGSEVTCCYSEHYALKDTKARQECLQQQYNFVCSCEACVNCWPLYSSLPSDFFYKCPKCSSPVDVSKKKCPGCSCLTSDLFQILDNTKVTLSTIGAKIDNSMEKYNGLYKHLSRGKVTTKDRQIIVEVIYWLSRYGSQPSQMLFEIQETLKHCFMMEGSHYSIQ